MLERSRKNACMTNKSWKLCPYASDSPTLLPLTFSGPADRLRSRRIRAARRGRSSSIRAVNSNPNPCCGMMCRTVASALTCPSRTRKWRLTVVPTGLEVDVRRNTPPMLISEIRDTSSRPFDRQMAQTPSGAATREVCLLVGKKPGHVLGITSPAL